MTKEVINTNNAPEAIGPYSQGVIVGDFVYTSGQIPLNPVTGDLWIFASASHAGGALLFFLQISAASF